MSMIFSEDNYEEALEARLRDTPLGISSSMAEDIFREQWEKDHPIGRTTNEDQGRLQG